MPLTWVSVPTPGSTSRGNVTGCVHANILKGSYWCAAGELVASKSVNDGWFRLLAQRIKELNQVGQLIVGGFDY